MANRPVGARARQGRRSRPTGLDVEVKINILHTIADAIYPTPAGKIREAVANSRDNEASAVVIAVDRTNSRISILDNGHGITKARFEEIFEHIGYPLLGQEEKGKLSYFGLGLMSVFQLGARVRLFTRPRQGRDLLLLEVEAGQIFAQKNKRESIASLRNWIRLAQSTEEERKQASMPLLNEFLHDVGLAGFPQHFTEIIVDGIKEEDLETICDPDFPESLSKVLPVPVRDDEPFLKRFEKRTAARIRAILADPTYCKTVDVRFGIQEEGHLHPLRKYFPKFRSDISFPDGNVYLGIAQTKDFAYYVVHTLAQDLQERTSDEGTPQEDLGGAATEERRIERETGFWIRSQNFLVKSADFLERPGPGRPRKRAIHRPLRNWVFGEVFHVGMEPFLTVSRTDFLFDRPAFGEFRDSFLRIVESLNPALRRIWEKRKRVVDEFVRPFADVAKPEGPLAKVEPMLRRMVGESLSQEDFHEAMRKKLASCREPSIEGEEGRIDLILKKTKRPITLGDDQEVCLSVDPAATGSPEGYAFGWDQDREQVTVAMSPEVFDPKLAVFLGETYEVYYVFREDIAAGISIDAKSHRIFVNPFNRDLRQFSVGILHVYVALELADALSNTKKELKGNFLSLLGRPSEVVPKYIAPLADHLRRTQALTS